MAELFTGLQRSLGTVLAFFYDVIPSFGLSIILVTFLLNVLLFPLTLRQTRATRAFQRVQPEIKRIQDEHKGDPETMQRELARAQREAGATPAGCLFPMLIQFPIWLAIYRVFRNVATIAHGSDVAPLIPKDSSLLAAIEAGKTHFLGLSLGTTMSDGFVSGMPAALPYILLLAGHDRRPVHPAVVFVEGDQGERFGLGERHGGPAGDHEDHACIHRVRCVQISCRSRAVLGDVERRPDRIPADDPQDGASIDAASGQLSRVVGD